MLIKDPPVQVTDNLWMLGTNQYPLYLVKGSSEGAIFEGGTGAMGPLVHQQMKELGIGDDFVKQLAVTHAHPDHVMAVPLFRKLFEGLVVLASREAADTLSVEKAIAFFCQLDDALTNSLLKSGLISDEHRPEPLADKQIAVDRLIAEGDTIRVDGLSFDVLQTGGHSNCSLSFHEPAGRLLIISDVTGYYMPELDCWWPCYFTAYGQYLDSIRRLAALEAEILCLSHNGVVKGAGEVESYFNDALAATQQYHERIVDEARAGRSVRQIAEQLGTEVHQKAPLLSVDFFQKNCGLLVKQSLKHEGISLDK